MVPHVHIHLIPRKSGDFEKNDEIYDAVGWIFSCGYAVDFNNLFHLNLIYDLYLLFVIGSDG